MRPEDKHSENNVKHKDNNEHEKKGFRPYTCIHKDEGSGCKFWNRHPKNLVYYLIPPDRCEHCGCKGTLQLLSTSS